MNFPKHWVKGTIEAADERGRKHQFSAWGWSDQSQRDAEKQAQATAARIAERILRGNRPDRYLYSDRPLREEVLEEFKDQRGSAVAVITRNSYGCQVLNTAAIMFVDVDLPRPTFLENLVHRFSSLFGSSDSSPGQRHEAAALNRLESFLTRDPQMGVRVYRTQAGLRYLFTHGPFEPASQLSVGMMQALGADPLYMKLCQAQESFRARLTPKPWRCGLSAPSVRWPWPDSVAETRFRQWEGAYMTAAQRFGTCQFIAVYGRGKFHPAIEPVVALHDQRTKAAVSIPLA